MSRKAALGPATPSSSAAGNSPQLVVGIDPGLNTTGYGVLNVQTTPPSLVEGGVIRGGAPGNLPVRLQALYRGMTDLLSHLSPICVAIEELYSHYERPRTAILMGHARGVICLAAAERNIPIVHYSATQVKKVLTGSGRSPKAQMQRAVARELKLAQIPEPPDVADALAVAICHAYLGRALPQMILSGRKQQH